jgi:GNAT superfamily N-acetyltransferase
LWDPEAPGEYQWFGFRIGKVRGIERRWHDDELIGADSSFLAVELEDGTCAGWVTWRAVAGSNNFEIGIALFPDHRGHGVGTQAQRQLVSYLFDTTTANRLQAGTELDNVAEQRRSNESAFGGKVSSAGCTSGRELGVTASCTACSADWLTGATEE